MLKIEGTQLGTRLLLLCIALTLVPPVVAQRVTSRAASRATTGASSTGPIVVGPNVQVSKAFADRAHNEIHLAANPRDPRNLIGGSMVWLEETNIQTVIAYASFDGGESWSPTLKFEDKLYHSDPAVGFDADGTAYFLQITTTDEREPKLYTHVYRSKDGGRSWLEPTILPMLDRHYVVVDDNPGKFQKSLYINGVSARAIRVQRSKDRGATFEGVIQAFAPVTDRRIAGHAPCVVLSDGTLVISFLDTPRAVDPDREGSPTKPNAILKVITSTDGGATFSEPVTVAPVGMGHALSSNAQHFSLASDRSAGPFKDRLYVTWTDS